MNYLKIVNILRKALGALTNLKNAGAIKVPGGLGKVLDAGRATGAWQQGHSTGAFEK